MKFTYFFSFIIFTVNSFYATPTEEVPKPAEERPAAQYSRSRHMPTVLHLLLQKNKESSKNNPGILWDFGQQCIQNSIEKSGSALCLMLLSRLLVDLPKVNTTRVHIPQGSRHTFYKRYGITKLLEAGTISRLEKFIVSIGREALITAFVGITRELLFPSPQFRAGKMSRRLTRAVSHHTAGFLSPLILVSVISQLAMPEPSKEEVKESPVENEKPSFLQNAFIVIIRALLEEGADRVLAASK